MNEQLMDTRIEDLELSVRSTNVLRRNGCKTLRDITRIPTRDRFLSFRNFGKCSVAEVLNKVHSLGCWMCWEDAPEIDRESEITGRYSDLLERTCRMVKDTCQYIDALKADTTDSERFNKIVAAYESIVWALDGTGHLNVLRDYAVFLLQNRADDRAFEVLTLLQWYLRKPGCERNDREVAVCMRLMAQCEEQEVS